MKRICLLMLAMWLPNQVIANDIPEPLAQWQDWVRYDQGHRQCPFFAHANAGAKSNHLCQWPEQLIIQVDHNQGRFQHRWQVIEAGWVTLPGDASSWPQAVKVNQQTVAVQNRGGKPQVYLGEGAHQIEGRFDWASRPESIRIPSQVADVQLELDQQNIKFPVIEKQALWLGETIDDQQVEANSLDMTVSRLIIDGHPITVFVAIDLQVSGVARNENLGHLVTPEYQVTRVGGDLNAYIDDEGQLWAQLKPGYSEILVSMNVVGWPDSLLANASGTHWPEQEVWAFQDNKNIRLTQVKGGTPINPEQTASRWLEVPNYLLNQNDEFSIVEQKRGTLNQSEQLALKRQAWLSFSGEGYRTKDHISGEKFDSWRLNASEGLQLLSAQSSGENLLITQSGQGHQGVELRTPAVDLTVNGETDQLLLHNISGWQVDFESVSTQLYFPHGYMALAAFGVDNSQNVWLEQWHLWDIFIVMLITVLTFQVVGLKSAIFAFVSLLLGFHEWNMPVYAWMNLVVALALVAWVPRGRWMRLFQLYAVGSLLVLFVQLAPHWIYQARASLYPQLEHSSDPGIDAHLQSFAPQSPLNKVYKQSYNADLVYHQASSNQMEIQSDLNDDEMVEEQGKIMVTGSRIKRSDLLNRYQSDALLQAGKGTPQWRHNAVVLNWDGPITADQGHRLVLISPWMRVIWRLLLIVTSVLWLWSLAGQLKNLFSRQKSAAVAGMVWMLVLFSPLLQANDYPSDKLLKQLQERLYQPAECQPHCAAIESAKVSVQGQQLKISLRYHASADVAAAIPSSKDWQVTALSINNQNISQRLQYGGNQWIALKSGVNDVEMTGYLATRNAIALHFPVQPGVVHTDSEAWQFAGLDGHLLSSDTLQLISTSEVDNDVDAPSQSTDIQTFVKVTRSVYFDDQWYIRNQVERVAPEKGVIDVHIPLLDHEFPVEKVQTNDQGDVLVSLGPDESTFAWVSRLERVKQLTLTAADSNEYIEEWHLVASPQWHMEISGIPLVAEASLFEDRRDYFMHMFLPRPHESINVNVSRPQSVAGDVLSIDSVANSYSLGKRTTKVVTNIKYRATQGGQFNVKLAKESVVKSVSFDGVESNLMNEDGVVAVGFLPGNHRVSIEWYVNQPLTMLHQTPTIALPQEYSNLDQTMDLPRDRWVLFGHSAGVGPAFLYWGELIVFLVMAMVLGRSRYSPLKPWQWLALGCAFGTFSWSAFVLIAVWLFFIGWKVKFAGFEGHQAKNIVLQWFSLLFSLVALSVLAGVVAYGLFSQPDMGITGSQSNGSHLHWYLDAGNQQVPQLTLFSLHLWWYKLLILLWSIWISMALLSWLKSLFKSFDARHWWPKFKRKKTVTEK